MTRAISILAALVFLWLGTAHAVQPDEILTDPVLEHRAREISKDLRCLVCQNQSIDDSDAPLARDLRIIVRERLVAGDSDDEVVHFVVARYGDFVLLNPPFKPITYILWIGPAAIFLFGAVAVVLFLRRRRSPAVETQATLSAEEQARIAQLIGEDEKR